MNPVLQINNLHISIETEQGMLHAVRGVDFEVHSKEIVGILGESGAGKSMTMKAVKGLLPSKAQINTGEMIFKGTSLLSDDTTKITHIRANEIACIPQNPTTAINPIITVGKQMNDVLLAKKNPAKKYTKKELKEECIQMLNHVGIDQPELRYHQYPFELSGGMCQRVVIAMALLGNPQLVICDEPTTSLDVTSQAKIIQLLMDLQKELGFAMIFISHNLAVLAKMCSRVYVMYSGIIVEEGDLQCIYKNAKHPYTIALFDALPMLDKKYKLRAIPGNAPSLINVKDMDQFADRNPYALEIDYKKEPPMFEVSSTHRVRSWLMHPLAKNLDFTPEKELVSRIIPHISDEIILELHNVSKYFQNRYGKTTAVKDVGFTVRKGEIFALVGESGSGKTTIGKMITGIHKPDKGEIYYKNNLLISHKKIKRNSEIQMVFQDANASLDPRMTVRELITEGLVIQKRYPKEEIEEKVKACLKEVSLSENILDRYPFEISGGQRQRVEIARALIVNPECLIADEPVSDLDASIQADIINLFDQIRRERKISIIFITHDISLIQYLADRVGVLYKGVLVELADKNDIFQNPTHEYTKCLFDSAPNM